MYVNYACSSTCFSFDELEPTDGDADDDGDEVAEPVLRLQGM